MSGPFVNRVDKNFINKRLALTSKLRNNAIHYIAYLYPTNALVLGKGIITKDLFHDFVVNERYRGCGVGSKILSMMLTHTDTPSFIRLYAKANKHGSKGLDQGSLQAFYARHGFIATGKVTSHGVEMLYDKTLANLSVPQFKVESRLLVLAYS
jgi:GNAT superfamily N-acetyltransferase